MKPVPVEISFCGGIILYEATKKPVTLPPAQTIPAPIPIIQPAPPPIVLDIGQTPTETVSPSIILRDITTLIISVSFTVMVAVLLKVL